MKKKFLFIPLFALFLSAFLLTGCDGQQGEQNRYETYVNAARYAMGNAEVSINVTYLDVDWVGGQVNLEYTDDAFFSYTESVDRNTETMDFDLAKNEDLNMRWMIDRATLRIKYAKSGAKLIDKIRKTLTIKVPKRTDLSSLSVKTVSARIESELDAWRANFETVSGRINCMGTFTNNLNFETVSGDVKYSTQTLKYATQTLPSETKRIPFRGTSFSTSP